jgi:hypothetical protein
MSYQVITEVINIQTSDTDWWMVYTPGDVETVSPLMQCGGYTSSPNIMVKGDDKAEIEQYIIDNDIKPFSEEDII